jgi:hypothetical protein
MVIELPSPPADPAAVWGVVFMGMSLEAREKEQFKTVTVVQLRSQVTVEVERSRHSRAIG